MQVSIIIRAYNAQKTISRALESAYKQTLPKKSFEIIVVDDGSIDDTTSIVENMTKLFNNLSIYSHKTNLGLGQAANTGVSRSRGKYIVYLDSDDEFFPEITKKLSVMLDKRDDVDYVFCDYFEQKEGKGKLVTPLNQFEAVMVGTMFRRKKLIDEGLFAKDLIFLEYELFLRTFEKWTGFHFPEALFVYHRGKKSITSEKKIVKFGIEQLTKIYPDKIDQIKKIRSY